MPSTIETIKLFPPPSVSLKISLARATVPPSTITASARTLSTSTSFADGGGLEESFPFVVAFVGESGRVMRRFLCAGVVEIVGEEDEEGSEKYWNMSVRSLVRWMRRRERAEGREIESRRMMEMRVWERSYESSKHDCMRYVDLTVNRGTKDSR
jgi:hypothetical protein